MSCVRNTVGFGCYDTNTFLSCVCGSGGSEAPTYNFPSGGGGNTGMGGMNIPTGVGNVGGWPGGSSGQLSQVLNSILAGIGLIQGANYIPTPLQTGQLPQGATSQNPQPIIYQQPVGGNYNNGGSNVAGSIQNLIEQHPIPFFLGIGGVVLLLMRPPTVSRAR